MLFHRRDIVKNDDIGSFPLVIFATHCALEVTLVYLPDENVIDTNVCLKLLNIQLRAF
jgi:hypothetical protein